MGIKKNTVITITYVCDNKNCKKADEDKRLFATDIPVIRDGAKDKLVLCGGCREEHDDFMERYDKEDEPGETQEDEYSPQVDPRMQKLTPEQRDHHYAAKKWAIGPKSTMRVVDRPKGITGPAGPKALAAYEAYLKELKAEAARVDAAVNGKAAT